MRPPPEGETSRASTPPLEANTIGPDNHPIKHSMIDRDALFVLKKLTGAGFSGYLVGGGVRDLYLGQTPKDFDISTDARPGQLRKLFNNSKTIGRRFRLVQIFFRNGKTIEVSTLRSLSEHDLDGPETVLAPNNTFGTLSEDARRRDLTINSLFYEIEDNTIIDYVDGIKDLQNSVIRIVGDPEKRIKRDPVRALRAIRHSARNNFTIETKTWQAICQYCNNISLCPPSRLRDEFLKDLYSGKSAPWFQLALNSGIFPNLFPLYSDLSSKAKTDSNSTRTKLHQIFTTIDRLNTLSTNHGIHRQPNHFLLALILTPWLEHEFQLYSHPRKRASLFKLTKTVRAIIDQTIGKSFNLRRSSRQEIVNLTINLAQLIHNKEEKSWPKWLQKKSYFKKCRLFYYFHSEANDGSTVDLETLLSNSLRKTDFKEKTSPRKSLPPKIRPAFSHNTKGGIFGFKK